MLKSTEFIADGDYPNNVCFIEKMPTNVDLLYKRALCKYELGNKEGACKDLNLIKQLGDNKGKELLLKWCK